MMKVFGGVITAALAGILAGCTGNANVLPEAAYFDLGGGTAPASAETLPLALRSLDVHGASWLGGSTMQYRLAYVEGVRRQAYIESRWAAPPAELLETLLRRRLVTGEKNLSVAGCRVRVDLDEFIQVYDGNAVSRAVIQARIGLYASRSEILLARQTINLNRAAASPDARGGVAAFAALGGEMAADIANWMKRLSSDTPGLVVRCNTGE